MLFKSARRDSAITEDLTEFVETVRKVRGINRAPVHSAGAPNRFGPVIGYTSEASKPDRASPYYLGRRNLPTIENPDSRLPCLGLAGLGQTPDQSDRRAHTRASFKISEPYLGSLPGLFS
jgi:hypothetical protein